MVDELHAGFLPATHYLLDQLDLGRQSRLLDVGCGIGGPARVAGQLYAARVTGVDLTPGFVAAASALSERLGLSDRGLSRHLRGRSHSRTAPSIKP